MGLLLIGLLSSCVTTKEDPYDFLFAQHNPTIFGARLIQISSADTTGGNNDRLSLQAGESREIVNQIGPGQVSRLWFTFDSRDPNYLRNIILKIYWEDSTIPAVLCPIGDFFGCGFQYTHWTSEFMGMSSGGFYCYWPMWFKQKLRIEIHNDSDYPLYALYFHCNVYLHEAYKNKPYFHALWNRDLRTQSDTNYTALDLQGSGVFVGLHYNAQGLSDGLGYLEGDEVIFIDDHDELTWKGTGMEDYLNSGWYFRNGVYSASHHGLIMKNDSLSRISAYRHHVRDAIPFQRSIKFTLEHGHANESIADISTVAFWYEDSPVGHSDLLPVKGLRNSYRRPIDHRSLSMESFNARGKGSQEIIDMSAYGVDWLNGRNLQITIQANAKYYLRVDGLEEKSYTPNIYFTAGPDFSQVRIHNLMIDLSNEIIKPLDAIKFDPIKTTNGVGELLFENTQQQPIKFSLDAVYLEPVRQYIPEWNFIGPFDNPRINDDLRFGLDSIYPPEIDGLIKDITYVGKNNQVLNWKQLTGIPAGYNMQLWKYIDPYEFVICYVHTFVYSEKSQTMDFLLGSDDGVKVFLNGEEVHRFLDVRIAEPDQTRIPIPLIAGWNSFMLKLENNFGGYAFYARFIDPEEGLKYSLDK